MITLDKCNRLLDEGFSLITVGENKVPNFSWKKRQTTAYTKDEFKKDFEYSGGKFKQNGDELQPTNAVGILTGFDYLECIDVDLKVFSTAKEQVDFWTELISFLSDNIFDFNSKFVVYRTKNAGYHILYKTKRVQGNTKIAKLKGHKEAVIETRGNGGYIFVYEKSENGKTYKDVQFITDEDRDILWSVCQTYDFIEEIPKEEKKELKKSTNSGLTPWDDFNSNHSVNDLICDEFDIIRNLKNKYIIKRHGAKSPHSGYIYKDSGCMFLFSTGTIYPNEKLLSPFAVYTYKEHSGDFSQSAKDLYSKGFGDRSEKNDFPENIEVEINVDDLEFPIDIFPENLQKYILSCQETLNSSVDYMGCALIWVCSVIIGNSMHIEVKKGWNEFATVWISLVGRAGVGKTPSVSNIEFPLNNINNREIKSYIKQIEKYMKFQELTKEEQQLSEEVLKPKKTQFIVNDITLEALIEMHSENKNSIGVFKDELAGWLKDMNKYRAGSDLEFWLSSWSGKSVNLNRKTAKSSFIDKPFIPVLGGIQPTIFNTFYTEENKDNGFMDRMLLSFPELNVEKYNSCDMSQELIDWYENYIVSFYEIIRRNAVNYNSTDDIQSNKAFFLNDAKVEWIRIFNEITDMQNSDHENEYMKSMLPKQKSYIPRFALILNTLFSFKDSNYDIHKISKSSILRAEKLSKYFIAMAKKVKVSSIEDYELKSKIDSGKFTNNYDKFKAIYKANPDVNKTKLSEILNVSRTMIYKYIKEYEQTQ